MKKPKTYSDIALGAIFGALSILPTYAQTGPAGVGNSTDNRVWLDANALGFADGSSVASWSDQSGNVANFTQGSSSNQPMYNTIGIGGLPSITFDGINDILASGALSDLETSNITYFAVYDRDGMTNDMMINAVYSDNPEKWRTYMNAAQNTIISAHYSPVIKWVRYTDPAGASFFSTHITPTEIRTYNQGVLGMTRTATYTIPGDLTSIYLGSRDGEVYPEYMYQGDLAEVIIYNDALNNLERVLVENYLGAKYGMSVPTDLYDYEASHQFGVIGLGDDGTNTQSTAQGNGILEISAPTDMTSGEFFLVGHSGQDLMDFNETDVPASLPGHQRFERTWRAGETGDVGTVTLTFNMGSNDFGESTSYRLLVDNDGVFDDATIVSGTYDDVTSTLTFTTNLSDGDYFTVSGILEILEIHSIADGLWSETSTWDCDCVPSTNDLVYIDPSTTVTVDVDAFADYLSIEALGTLVMSSDVTLDIDQNFDIAGSASFTDGLITLTGDVAQTVTVSAASVNLHDILVENSSLANITFVGTFFLDGTFFPNEGSIVIDPSASFTVTSTSSTEGGRIGPILAPADITGTFSVQRFVPAGPADWRNLCSPVVGSTFADWDPDLAMSGPGFPDGCAYGPDGCFFSVLYTNNSVSNKVLNASDPILNNRGFEVYVGDDLDVFSGTTLTSTGTLNTAANVVRTLNTGWATIGNPYASAITFSTIGRAGSIGAYFYVYDPSTGSYQWYDATSETSSVPSISSEGLIAMGQGFWMYANSVGDITFDQTDKTANTATFFKASEAPDETLQLTLKATKSTYSCTLFLAEHEEATDGMDELMDIRHLATGKELAPSLAIQSEENLLRKNYIKKDGREKSFTLHTSFKEDGYYTFSAENWVNFNELYARILLYDALSGEMVDLKENDYSFYATEKTTEHDRFTLILSQNPEAVTGTVGEGTTFADIHSNVKIKQMHNIIDVQLTEDDATLTTVKVTNILGQKEVFNTTTQLLTGSNLITLPSTLKGFHLITLQTGDRVVTQKIML